MSGEATDQTKDEAWQQSRNCIYCSGGGMLEVFHPKYTGARVADLESVVRGEVKMVRTAMVVAAHCTCPMGRWMRSKTKREDLPRIVDLEAIISGRSRWLADDPTGDTPYEGRVPSVGEMKRRVTQPAGGAR